VEDPGITPLGIQQAHKLADRLGEVRIDVLLTSAFRRALETMRPLARVCNKSAAIWTDLHELGGCYRGHVVGQLEGRPGMTRAEIETEFPEFEIPADIDARGWWKGKPFESMDDARRRAERQVARLVEEFGSTGCTVACIVHADFKELLVRSIVEEDIDTFSAADLHNTGVSLFHFDQGKAKVLEFNDTAHLTNGLRSS
jgi:broad specificity phosphatase PhoE